MMKASQIEREKELVSKHYNIDPQLFSYFLDRRMKYSSGYFLLGHENLDEAQEQKLEYLAQKLQLGSDDHLLDVGCGWGSAILYFAEKFGSSATGVTLAESQAKYVEQRAKELGIADKIRVKVQHFQETAFEQESFNKIIFIGSIIHIGDRKGTADICCRLLKPQGKLLISETYYPNTKDDGKKGNRAEKYISEGVFGYGNLLTVGEEIRNLEEAGFEILHVENITEHYIKTLDKWIENVKRNQEAIDSIMPEESRQLRTYLTLAKKVFRQRASMQFHILCQKL